MQEVINISVIGFLLDDVVVQFKYENGDLNIVPQIKSYTFTCDGKEWSADRWCLDVTDENVEIDIQAMASSKTE